MNIDVNPPENGTRRGWKDRALVSPGSEELLKAARVLAALVREEYPDRYTLSEIASTWTPAGTTEDEIQALRAVEDQL